MRERLRASVVVCTRNRAGLLAGCLRSILEDGSTTPRELVVADNASTDATREVVAEAARIRPDVPVRHVVETRLGSSHARNRGIDAARGELLLFTDDDVLVEDGWADALVAGFADPRVGAVGGRILPLWPEPPPVWMNGPHARLLTLVDLGTEERLLGPAELPLGANMAVRADVAAALAPAFDPTLGQRDSRRLAHEEYHLVNRIRATHLIAYRPDAVVGHRIAGERVELGYMRRAFMQLGVGLGRRERLEGVEAPSLPRLVVRTARTIRGARRSTSRNDAAPRLGPETDAELRGYMWAGRHVELLLGRFPRLSEWAATRLA